MTLNDKDLEEVCGSEKLIFASNQCCPDAKKTFLDNSRGMQPERECRELSPIPHLLFFTLYSAVDSISCDTGMIFYSVSVILDLQAFIVLFMRFFYTRSLSGKAHLSCELF